MASLRVIEDRPGRRRTLSFVVVFLGILLIVLSFFLGYQRGAKHLVRLGSQLQAMNRDFAQCEAQVLALEKDLTVVSIGSEVDKKANEDVRLQIMQLRDDIARLSEDNTFYKNLMAPSSNQSGLSFGNFELGVTDSPRVYRFKLVMQQFAKKHQLISGTLRFDVLGQLNNQKHRYSLHELTDDVALADVKLRFKYFQTIEGTLHLPDGFDAERVELVAKSRGKNAVTIEKRFVWLVEEA